MNKYERNDRSFGGSDRGYNRGHGQGNYNEKYGNSKKLFSGSSKPIQEESKKELSNKDDILLFDEDDQSVMKNKPNEKPSNSIETIFKKLKKGREEYSKLEIKQPESRRDRDNSNGFMITQPTEISNIPWMSKKTMGISSSLVRAHNEIIEFVNYIVPTKEDHAIREASLEK